MAENVEKPSVESHENVKNLAYWVCLPSKKWSINDQYVDVYSTGKGNYQFN